MTMRKGFVRGLSPQLVDGYHLPVSLSHIPSVCVYMIKMYIFLSGLLKTWRENSPSNMGQIHSVKYSVTKRLGDKTIQKSHNVELQVTFPGVNILVSHL